MLKKMKHMVFGLLAFVLFFGAVGHTRSADVHALFDLGTPTGGPFPSNWFTVPDNSQNTGRRVDLPPPDPSSNPSEYHDTQVLNTLDGFSMQPRLSIPFDGAIDVNTVNSKTHAAQQTVAITFRPDSSTALAQELARFTQETKP